VSSSQNHLLIAAVSLTLAPISVAVGQSSVAVSPFASYVPSAAQNPLVGMALTFGGTTGLALRGSADISIKNPGRITSDSGSTGGGMRPWGADADAMLFLGGLGGGATVFSRALSPYVFSGIGLTGGDSAGVNIVNNVWSYGAGATIPLGFDASLFGEARWRMSEYVLPTAKDAPSSKSEMRFGLSFHVGGGGSRQPAPAPLPRRRERYHSDSYDVYDDYEYDRAVAARVAEPVVVLPEPATTPSISTEPATTIDAPVPDQVIRSRARIGTTRRVESTTVTRGSTVLRRSRGILTRSRATSSRAAAARATSSRATSSRATTARSRSVQTQTTRTKTTASSTRRSRRQAKP
jgi:hypothetical protein